MLATDASPAFGESSPTASPGFESSAIVLAQARPKITKSRRLLAPSLLAPWTEQQPTSPVIWFHISKSCIDPTLGSNSMGSSWEELGNNCCLETFFNQSKSCSKPCTTCSNDHCIIVVVTHRILARNRLRIHFCTVLP